jgi:hypothetical protein
LKGSVADLPVRRRRLSTLQRPIRAICPPGIDLHQLAPWAIVARTLLNLDETITRH